MTRQLQPIEIRAFEEADAEACCRIRTEAFKRVFSEEMGAEAVAAGISAYKPADYVRLAREAGFFVATEADHVVGFCTVRLPDPPTAEILFLYVRLDRVGRGIGSLLAAHAEKWVLRHCPGVSELVLDTGVPGYNQTFWEKLGFEPRRESVLSYPGCSAPALRLGKTIPCT